jgi:hypothetical protein
MSQKAIDFEKAGGKVIKQRKDNAVCGSVKVRVERAGPSWLKKALG